MVKITIDLQDEGLKDLPSLGKKARKSILRDASGDMVRFLMMNSPYDHGLLRSWFIESLSDVEASIKSPAKYAIYQDQGTKPYVIKPRNKKALFWSGAEHPVKMVRHPGLKGKHFVEKSFKLVRPRMGGYLARALENGG